MVNFAAVRRELKTWMLSFQWVNALMPLRLILLFGGLGLTLIEEMFYRLLPYSIFNVMDFFFYTIPLSAVATYAFLLGAWLTLVSDDLKLLPFGLWGKAFVILFPFSGWWLNSLIGAAIYAYLGYCLYRFTVSAEAANRV